MLPIIPARFGGRPAERTWRTPRRERDDGSLPCAGIVILFATTDGAVAAAGDFVAARARVAPTRARAGATTPAAEDAEMVMDAMRIGVSSSCAWSSRRARAAMSAPSSSRVVPMIRSYPVSSPTRLGS
jgi:hypothetical protein